MKILLIRDYVNSWDESDAVHDSTDECDFSVASNIQAALRNKEVEVDMVLLDYDDYGPFSKRDIRRLRHVYKNAYICLMMKELAPSVRNVMRRVDGFLLKPLEEESVKALYYECREMHGDETIETGFCVPENLKAFLCIAKLKGYEIIRFMKKNPYLVVSRFLIGISVISVCVYGINQYHRQMDRKHLLEMQQELLGDMERVRQQEETQQDTVSEPAVPDESVSAEKESVLNIFDEMLPEMKVLYDRNNDVVGWLKIPDTKVNYPVMQTMEDEEYYIRRDFDGKENRNGSLFADTDSVIGNRIEEKPSTNIIIYGHTMKTGEMFGQLKLYQEEEYCRDHPVIYFDTLYENREYEVISVFYSQIFHQEDKVFKYYQFFQAETEEEFDDWYKNIKKKSIFDTGIEAEFGDEFITLSCCSYMTEHGRFVVIGRRKNQSE